MPAMDYARVAELYDDYCVFAGDIPFCVALAGRARGGRPHALTLSRGGP